MGCRDFLDDLDYEIVLAFANNNMRVHPAGKELQYSDGTIQYHLRKIKRITGQDPYKFWDLVNLCKTMKKEWLDVC